jgi:transposase
MSAKVLYHAMGIQGYREAGVVWEEAELVVHLEQPRESLRCPRCNQADVHAKGSVSRRFRGVPIGLTRVWIALDVPRVWCGRCGIERQVRVKFADPMRRHTRAFERMAAELSHYMQPADVAKYLGIGWDLAADIIRRNLKRKYGRPSLHQLRRIAIDEIYVGKRHKYLTLVLDLDRGAVVFVGKGKGGATLTPFWRKLEKHKAAIQAVATDMSRAYVAAVRKHLPTAALVFDRFHVVKLMNEKLTDLRRQLYREATTLMQQAVLKGTRWLLLMNPENLDDGRNEPARLREALQLNEPLAIAYYLKEDLRQFWNKGTKAAAERFLLNWCVRAMASRIRVIMQFGKLLLGLRPYLLAWYDHPISTGPLEGTNNKIKLLQRQAFGYRDYIFFKLRILTLHLSRKALIGPS